jgi:hypothetical protein
MNFAFQNSTTQCRRVLLQIASNLREKKQNKKQPDVRQRKENIIKRMPTPYRRVINTRGHLILKTRCHAHRSHVGL